MSTIFHDATLVYPHICRLLAYMHADILISLPFATHADIGLLHSGYGFVLYVIPLQR